MKTIENEIRIITLLKKVWKNRRVFLWNTLIWFFFGIFIAVLSPSQFTATSVFLPQSSDRTSGFGSLGGIASLAGINLGNMNLESDIPSSLYPKLVSSVNFKKEIINADLKINGVRNNVTYKEYFEEIYDPGILSKIQKYTIGLPTIFLNFFKKTESESFNSSSDELIKLSENEVKHFKRIENQLSIIPNKKEGFVQLSFTMPDPILAAQMASYVESLLQRELIKLKINNANNLLIYTENRFKEKKQEFEQIQSKLSNFRDRNQNISTASANNQLLILESQYNLAFNLYNELAKQLEQSKLQVSKDTPVFSVIQPVSVPIEKSAPNRFFILFVFTFIGFLISIAIIFGKDYYFFLKNEWRKIK